MATETSINTYTGVDGVVTYDGNPFIYCKMDVTISRDVVNVPRGGKWSDLALPGKVKPKVKITYGLVDADLLINALDDGTNTVTSSDETLHAAIAGTGAEAFNNSTWTNPSVPMSLKLKVISTDGYAATHIVVSGTDSNDNPVSETISILTQATGSTTVYYYGVQKFKTVESAVMPAALSANDNVTFYGAGQRTITLGKPKFVTVTAKVMKSATQYILLTMTNCWLSGLPLALSSASDAVLPAQDLEIRDPDANITLTVNP